MPNEHENPVPEIEVAKPERQFNNPLPEGWDTQYAYPPIWTTKKLRRVADADEGYSFPTEAEAKRVAARHNREMGFGDKNINRYVAAMMTWRRREATTLDYSRLPVWNQESFWQRETGEGGVAYDHHVMVSEKDPTMLTYFQGETKACLGIRTPIKPGRYLTKFFPTLGEKKIKALVEWMVSGIYVDPTFEGSTLEFATTPDDIVKVYKDGPASCMSHETRDYSSGTHPVRAYGAGALAVAYFKAELPNRRTGMPVVAARALCWPENKVFGRIYPTPGNAYQDGFTSEQQLTAARSLLENMLRKDGYQGLHETRDGFEGAALLRINCETQTNAVVMPYLDNNYGVHEDEETGALSMSIRNATHGGGSTSGWINVHPRYVCGRCGKNARGRATHVNLQVSADGRGFDRQAWCSVCTNEHAYVCTGTRMWMDDTVEKVSVRGALYSRAWADANLQKCQHCGDIRQSRLSVTTGANVTELWCETCAVRHSFTCVATDVRMSNELRHQDGHPVWRAVDASTLHRVLGGYPKEDPRGDAERAEFVAPPHKAWVARLVRVGQEADETLFHYWNGGDQRGFNSHWTKDFYSAAMLAVRPLGTLPKVYGAAARNVWRVEWVLVLRPGYNEDGSKIVGRMYDTNKTYGVAPAGWVWVQRSVARRRGAMVVAWYWTGGHWGSRIAADERVMITQKTSCALTSEAPPLSPLEHRWVLVPKNGPDTTLSEFDQRNEAMAAE